METATTYNYMEKFMTLLEAMKAAKKQSRKLGLRLYLIESHQLFFVYSDSMLQGWERLVATYERGRQVGE